MKNPRMRAVTAARTATTAYIDMLEVMPCFEIGAEAVGLGDIQLPQ